MIYRVFNMDTGLQEYFDTKEEAEARSADLLNGFKQREDYRFSIAKIVVDGNNTTWAAADLNNDAEDGEYKVFVHTTGLYEDVAGLTAAKARMQQLKDEFFTGLYPIQELEQMPTLKNESAAPIPTETM